jgi:hypothetical protein
MASLAQTIRLSKLSFPRYTTGLATTPQVHQTLALYILRATQGTHVSDHRESPTPILTSSTRRTLPRFRSPPRLHWSSRRSACARRRTVSAHRSDLNHAPRSSSQYVPPATLPPLHETGPVALLRTPGDRHYMQPLRLPIRGSNNLMASTWLFCSTPQGTAIQRCLSAHRSAATCRVPTG